MVETWFRNANSLDFSSFWLVLQMVSMKLRKPKCTASIWSSGKITVTGSTSEEGAKKSARQIARILQKMGFKIRFSSFRVVNVLGIVNLPFGIKIAQFTENHPRVCSYEPEIHPGATYRWKEVKATFKIFQTGAITLTAPNVASIETAVQHIYPLVVPFRKEKPMDPHLAHMKALRAANGESNGGDKSNGKKRSRSAASSGAGGKKKKARRRSMDSEEDEEEFLNDNASNHEEEEELSSGSDAQFTDEEEKL